MNRLRSTLLPASVALLCACGGGGSGGSGGPALGAATATTVAQCTGALAGLTYAADVKLVFDTHCTACHDSAKSGAARNNAPPDHNFNTLALIKFDATHLDHIDRVAGMNPTGSVRNTAMPPASALTSPSDQERQKLSCWIAEGAN